MLKRNVEPTEFKKTTPDASATRTVAICGDSVLLLSVGASLRPNVKVEIVPRNATVSEMLRQVKDSSAEAVVFEMGPAGSEWAFEFLRSEPDLLLVGVEWNSDRVLVLSSRSVTARSGEDLLMAIGIKISSVLPHTRTKAVTPE